MRVTWSLDSSHDIVFSSRADRTRTRAFSESQTNRVGNVEFVAPTLVEGTLRRGFSFYRRLTSPFARAVFHMFVVSEVHPFEDGNGRIARVMMNAELVAAAEQRIIIPQVYRNDYLMALRALTVNERADALISTLDFAQRYTASLDYSDFERARAMLEQTNAFRDPAEADASGMRLTLPEPSTTTAAWRLVGGPREYSEAPEGADIDVGWMFDIEREGERRTVRVEVAGGRLGMPDLPRESKDAIQSQGRSAISPLLTQSDPPTRVLVTSGGLFTRP